MKKILLKIVSLMIVFAIGWILSLQYNTPETVIIEKEKIVYNTITKNINDMTPEEIANDLKCFYTSEPLVDINHIHQDEYLLSAKLCDREWSRKTKIIIPPKQYKHLIIGGLFLNSQIQVGANIQYYRMYGRFGIGGGLSITQGYGSIQGGIAFQF